MTKEEMTLTKVIRLGKLNAAKAKEEEMTLTKVIRLGKLIAVVYSLRTY